MENFLKVEFERHGHFSSVDANDRIWHTCGNDHVRQKRKKITVRQLTETVIR